jgi:hypothetical protein
MAVLTAPFEDFLIRAAFQRAFRQRVEVHTEEFAHAFVERAVASHIAEVVALGQPPSLALRRILSRMRPNTAMPPTRSRGERMGNAMHPFNEDTWRSQTRGRMTKSE